MTESNRSAVDIDSSFIEAQLPYNMNALRGERLVDLIQSYVIRRNARQGQRLRDRLDGACAH
ncbi:hypothetical protein D3C77_443510 [compost metagenome]